MESDRLINDLFTLCWWFCFFFWGCNFTSLIVHRSTSNIWYFFLVVYTHPSIVSLWKKLIKQLLYCQGIAFFFQEKKDSIKIIMQTVPAGSTWSNRTVDGKFFKNLGSERTPKVPFMNMVKWQWQRLTNDQRRKPVGGYEAFQSRWCKPCDVA